MILFLVHPIYCIRISLSHCLFKIFIANVGVKEIYFIFYPFFQRIFLIIFVIYDFKIPNVIKYIYNMFLIYNLKFINKKKLFTRYKISNVDLI